MRPPHRNTPGLLIKTPPATPGQRIGLMGGSFNPPHEGHLTVARAALRRLRIDQIWWIVSPGNPLKSHYALQPLADRMAACRALTHHDPKICVTGFEEDLKTAYTASTVAFLTRRYSTVDFVWVMGADNLATFHRWYRWRDIAARIPIAVVDRPGWHLKAVSSPAALALSRFRHDERGAASLPAHKPPAWTVLTTPLSHLSSTDLRRKTALKL